MRWTVGALLLVALLLRVGFVLLSPPRALYWDEPIYDTWAARYQAAWSSLLAGGEGPSLGEAIRPSLQRGEVYAATVALVYSLFGREPRAVFLLQAILDGATCLFLWSLARSVGGSRAGWIAMALAVLYEPFTFAAARLQTETLTSLLYVGALWTICVPERRRAAALFCAGILVAVAMLARPALQWLFPVLVPAVLVRHWHRPERWALALAFATGFFLLVGPRLVLTTALTGRPIWAGTLDPSVDMYAGAIIGNAGWKTDKLAFANPPRDELLAILGDPPARRWTTEDMRRATIHTWLGHPWESAAVMLHKLHEAWLHPYNDSRWTLLTGDTGQAISHRVMLLLALVGMPLSLYRWRTAVPLVAAALYLWITYLAVKIEVRYAVVAMPVMICFAAVALAVLSEGWEQAWRAERRRLLVLATVTVAAVAAAIRLDIEHLLQLAALTPDVAHGVRVAVLLGAMTCLAYAVIRLTSHLGPRSTRMALLAPSFAVAAFIVLFGRPLAGNWGEWRSTLRANHGIARQEFLLPTGIERPRSAELRFDLLPEGEGGYDVVVRANGEEIRRYRGGLARGDADLPQERYYQQLFAARRRTSAADRAWYAVGISPDLIVAAKPIAVDIALEAEGEPRGSVTLFGDDSPDALTYGGPSLFSPALRADTSLYKYLAEDDFRMRRSLPLAGPSRSSFYDGRAWSEQDLGLSSGRQRGRYRIYLLLVYDRGIAVL